MTELAMAGSRGKPFHLVSELNWGLLFGEPGSKKDIVLHKKYGLKQKKFLRSLARICVKVIFAKNSLQILTTIAKIFAKIYKY
jgi:hypothetical protein